LPREADLGREDSAGDEDDSQSQFASFKSPEPATVIGICGIITDKVLAWMDRVNVRPTPGTRSHRRQLDEQSKPRLWRVSAEGIADSLKHHGETIL
jgi:hypothetical protein